ncbi:3-hydroxyacyl-CoA dehydrogenase NAD-binding domain-containing protein [uncultured Sphingomonas sp.]|uniref:3-hydroxyacyl-CoA dehydrogenase NAD-binding domain-containing protein n=1 Tax=uncultured Sphingomonas sp. TaxID=158754 RepID=UPI0035CA745D
MQMNATTDYRVDERIAIVTVDHPPVNALSLPVREGLIAALDRALADSGVDAVVVTCAGRTFFAGADITEFAAGPRPPLLRDVQQVFEDSAKPIVAAIHGTALGGGLELALVCGARIATPSAQLGLPEVKLGLLPAAGGTQRLPRIVGVEVALDLVTSGRHVGARQALALGLVDALAGEGRLVEDAVALARKLAAGDPLPRLRDRNDRLVEARGDLDIFNRFRAAHAKAFRGFDAPEYNIRAIEAAVALPFDEGQREERRLFDVLFAGNQSLAQRHAFFAERAVAKVPGLAKNVAPLPVDCVAVIGAGTMGAGIAMTMLDGGLAVTLVETGQPALDRGLATIRRTYAAQTAKGRLSAGQVEERLARLNPTLAIEAVEGCDLIVEAVFEQLDIKTALFARLDRLARPGAILATNTSYLDIDAIAAATTRPGHVVGLHFFSPANIMRLLEIVRATATAPAVIATALALAKRIGKTGVVVGNGWGFVGNRMLAPRQREAEKLLLEGALPWDVDRVLTGFGFPMGPFQMRDLAGNDVGWDKATSRSATVRDVLNERGRFGQKAGAGYYDYPDGGRTPLPSPEVERIVLEFAARAGIARRAIGDDEVRARTLYPMVNEGARILAEGKAARAADIDVVWLAGYGWPRYRGGPMFWAGLEGLPKIVETLSALEAAHGADFAVAPLLAELAARGRTFEEAR